jgi:hypothetical protein
MPVLPWRPKWQFASFQVRSEPWLIICSICVKAGGPAVSRPGLANGRPSHILLYSDFLIPKANLGGPAHMLLFRLLSFCILFFFYLDLSGMSQTLPADVAKRVDLLLDSALKPAMTLLPCKVKTAGKPKMIRWQDVDKCLNKAVESIDWDDLSAQMRALKNETRANSSNDFLRAVDKALSARALTYDKVFIAKDPNALLPLTHSVLKYLPPDSLQDLAVIGDTGEKVGTFAGVYLSERSGGLAGVASYSLARFQYKDEDGNLHSAVDSLHLPTEGIGSYGIPWGDAMSQPGFRLTSERLNLGR